MLTSIAVFSATYLLLITEKFPRYIIAMIGALLAIVFGVLTMDDAIHFVSWETIGLLLGMFIIIKVLEDGNFFNFLAVKVMELSKFNVKTIYFIFPLLTALLSGFMDSITVLLFFTILTINLCKMFELNPVPLVIGEVCTANIGGSATLVGDPPNVIIGSILHYTFTDFVSNLGLIALVATIAVTTYFFIVNHKDLKNAKVLSTEEKKQIINNNKITDKNSIKVGLISFIIAITLLILHPLINQLVGFHINASIATLLPAFVCLIYFGDKSEEILKSIDGVTLIFFIGLFIVIGGLEKSGAITLISNSILNLSNGHREALPLLLIFGCGLISAIVDNVPMALTMSYILMNMIGTSPDLIPMQHNLVWSLASGLDIGGNMTPIGASANVMAYTILQKNKISVGWGKWMKLAVPSTLIALLISAVGIYSKI